jgi:hypothetical protein
MYVVSRPFYLLSICMSSCVGWILLLVCGRGRGEKPRRGDGFSVESEESAVAS